MDEETKAKLQAIAEQIELRTQSNWTLLMNQTISYQREQYDEWCRKQPWWRRMLLKLFGKPWI